MTATGTSDVRKWSFPRALNSGAVLSATDLRNKLVEVIITPLLELLFLAALLVFVWGLFQFLIGLNKGGDTAAGKQHMLWGIIGLVVMTSAYAIINIVIGSFGVSLPK